MNTIRTGLGFYDTLESISSGYDDIVGVVEAFHSAKEYLEEMGCEFSTEILKNEDPEAPGDFSQLLVFRIPNMRHEQLLATWRKLAKEFTDRLTPALRDRIYLVLRTA